MNTSVPNGRPVRVASRMRRSRSAAASRRTASRRFGNCVACPWKPCPWKPNDVHTRRHQPVWRPAGEPKLNLPRRRPARSCQTSEAANGCLVALRGRTQSQDSKTPPRSTSNPATTVHPRVGLGKLRLPLTDTYHGCPGPLHAKTECRLDRSGGMTLLQEVNDRCLRRRTRPREAGAGAA